MSPVSCLFWTVHVRKGVRGEREKRNSESAEHSAMSVYWCYLNNNKYIFK